MASVNPLLTNPPLQAKPGQGNGRGADGSFGELFSGLAQQAARTDKPAAPSPQRAHHAPAPRREAAAPARQPTPPEASQGAASTGTSQSDASTKAAKADGGDEEGKSGETADAAATATDPAQQLLVLAAAVPAGQPADAKAAAGGDRPADLLDKPTRHGKAGAAALLQGAGQEKGKPEAGDADAAKGESFIDSIADAHALTARSQHLGADEHAEALLQAAAKDTAPADAAPAFAPALHRVAEAAQAAARPDEARLSPRVGSAGWDRALGQKVVWMVGSGEQSASLTLNPPDLGPLQVVLTISESQASADFRAAQPEVRQALQDALPRLREMLGEAGISLAQANVSSGMPGSGSSGFDGSSSAGAGGRRGSGAEGGGEPVASVTPSGAAVVAEGLVNTYA